MYEWLCYVQLKKMNFDEMLSMFQEVIQDVLGQIFKPDKVWYLDPEMFSLHFIIIVIFSQ